MYSVSAPRPHRSLRLATAALALVSLAACNPFAGPAAGARLYDQSCAGCHGPGATGGPGGPDLTGLAAARAGGFPRAEVLNRLDGYGRGLTRHEATMPDLSYLMTGRLMHVDMGRGASRMMPERVVALAAYLESIQR